MAGGAGGESAEQCFAACVIESKNYLEYRRENQRQPTSAIKANIMNTIKYTDDKGTNFNKFKIFIINQDKRFIPPLSTRIDINTYCDKLWKEAKNFIAINEENDEIIGICSFYCTPGKYKSSFLSLLSVDESFQKTGIGEALIKKWAEYAWSKGMETLETKTWEKNEKMKRLLDRSTFTLTNSIPEFNNRITLSYKANLPLSAAALNIKNH